MTKIWKRIATTMAAGCMAFTGTAMWAQATPAPVASKEFEVMTVKPSDPEKQGGTLMLDGEKFWTEGQTLKGIMKFAYGLNMNGEQQIVGGPKWVGEQKWDVTAKEDADTVAAVNKMQRDERLATIRLLVQAMLAQRYHLKVHRETREMPVYALVVAKGGAKMAPAKVIPVGPDGHPTSGSGVRDHGKGDIEGMSCPASLLADVLGHEPEIGGKTVIDKTGLTGKYDFELKWSPDLTATSDDQHGPSLFTALQEELGLKLESTKAPVEVIVIDGVEQPSEN